MRPLLLILLAATAVLPCRSQRLTILLDPARGGSEYGARIDGKTYEKQVTLDLANRLRALLTARDFNVVLTRESDVLVTNGQRAAIANQSKAVACILLHATAVGTGPHLWTSSLSPAVANSYAIPWDAAQSSWVDRSQRLTTEFASAFSHARLPVSSGHTWILPLDNMECPALAIEIAPENGDTTAADHDYQNRVAAVIANELLFWRGHTDIMQSILNPPSPPPPAPKVQATSQGGVPGTSAGNAAPGDAKHATSAVTPTTGIAKSAAARSTTDAGITSPAEKRPAVPRIVPRPAAPPTVPQEPQ